MQTTKADENRPSDVIETARRAIAGLLASLQAPGDHGTGRAGARTPRDPGGDDLREVFARDLRDLSLRQAPLCRRRPGGTGARRLH